MGALPHLGSYDEQEGGGEAEWGGGGGERVKGLGARRRGELAEPVGAPQDRKWPVCSLARGRASRTVASGVRESRARQSGPASLVTARRRASNRALDSRKGRRSQGSVTGMGAINTGSSHWCIYPSIGCLYNS